MAVMFAHHDQLKQVQLVIIVYNDALVISYL